MASTKALRVGLPRFKRAASASAIRFRSAYISEVARRPITPDKVLVKLELEEPDKSPVFWVRCLKIFLVPGHNSQPSQPIAGFTVEWHHCIFVDLLIIIVCSLLVIELIFYPDTFGNGCFVLRAVALLLM